MINAETAAGLPSQELSVKVDMLLMLLRDLDPVNGIFYGTRFILKHLVSRDQPECEMRDERGDVKLVWVPRIKRTPKDDLHPYQSLTQCTPRDHASRRFASRER